MRQERVRQPQLHRKICQEVGALLEPVQPVWSVAIPLCAIAKGVRWAVERCCAVLACTLNE